VAPSLLHCGRWPEGATFSEDLCRHNVTKSEAQRLAAPFLAELNESCSPRQAFDQNVVDFWNETFEPFITIHVKASTRRGYLQIWNQHLVKHFESRTLRTYQTYEATNFLTALARSHGRHTVQHVRSLMSAIFKHASSTGACSRNTIRDCKVLGTTIAPSSTNHYTLEEAENIVTALVDRVDAQLVFVLAFFCGLRPSEIAALQWGDIDSDFIHIRRAVCIGVVGTTKTGASVRSIPMVGIVKMLLKTWREKSPSQYWIFPDGEQPMDIVKFVNRVIVPRLRHKCEWKGLYAARRGFATVIASGSTDGGLSLMHLMGHKTLDVTIRNYVKRVPEDLVRTMQLMERAGTRGETLQ
jgi:integrase